jgi:aspartate/methionine/tyrosine aminotransferase
LMQCISAMCGPGDEVIIPAPHWVSYSAHCALAGATDVTIPTLPEDGFLLQPAALEAAIKPSTRMLLLCNPSNPTGAVYPQAHLEALAEVLRKHPHVLIIADEIYERITYDTPHVAFGALDGMLERTVTINGFSKSYAMTGFRIGYLAAALPIVRACEKLQGQITSCASSVGQHAARVALRDVSEEFFDEAIAGFRVKRDYVLAKLAEIPGITCSKPEGAFYVFPVIEAYYGATSPSGTVMQNSNDVCVYILNDQGVALVAGVAFGDDRCLRISYATSMRILEDAMIRIARAFAKLEIQGGCTSTLKVH